MKTISLIIALLISVSVAHAQPVYPTPPYTAQDINNSCGVGGVCGQVISSMITGGSPGTFTELTITSGNATFSTSGKQPVFPLPGVLTPSTSFPTPSSSNAISARYNSIAAAAPTAAFVVLPQMTSLPSGSLSFGFFNASANPVAIVPYTGDALNAAGANTPTSCTAAKYCECTKTGAASAWCTVQ